MVSLQESMNFAFEKENLQKPPPCHPVWFPGVHRGFVSPWVWSIKESRFCKMAFFFFFFQNVWIIWLIHWWGGWMKIKVIQVAELSTVISIHLDLYSLCLSLCLTFFTVLKCSPFAPTSALSFTCPVPSPGFPTPLTWDLRLPVPTF